MTDANGRTIQYTLAETPVANYVSEVSGTTITNRLVSSEIAYISVSGTKTWNDQDNARGLRPQSIVVRLLQDGAVIQEKTVTEQDGWSYRFEQLPDTNGYGHTYVYTVSEQMVKGYYAQINGFDITNTILPERDGGRHDDPSAPKRSSVPPFEEHTEEEMEEFIDIFDYDIPLWGGLLSTGDEVPVYPYVFAGIGVAALAVLAIFGRRKKRIRR